ncbi:MAG: hypothetical protein D6746_15840 [Bacteroidetes bacterium]|nr:MAG: hypothetical protein D6746_15840 [Bacteroidota bacterium]
MKDDDPRRQEALFRYSVLGSVLAKDLARGELKPMLQGLAAQEWLDATGAVRQPAWRTIEEWYYRYKRGGFEGLLPARRSDCGKTRALSPELRELILDMKKEDPGRTGPLIVRELETAGLVSRGKLSLRTVQRLLRREGLSRPKLELDRPERLRWQAESPGELWQTDCVHGPKLFDPESGRELRVKIFALLDDCSRLVVYARASFRETQESFLRVLLSAVRRRGVPRSLYCDQHKSFTGSDTHTACAKLGIRVLVARPYDGPAKGKIERFWRTLRSHVLDRLDLEQVVTLDDLNLRLSTWIETEYNRRPHSALAGRSPLEVWEGNADQQRWVEDPARLEQAFTGSVTRTVRGDSTVQIQNRHYEVPSYLRGLKVKVGYSLLKPALFWVEDGDVRIPLRQVQPEENASRPRQRVAEGAQEERPRTGLNAVEDLLRRVSRPLDEGGAA